MNKNTITVSTVLISRVGNHLRSALKDHLPQLGVPLTKLVPPQHSGIADVLPRLKRWHGAFSNSR
jgi:hypothetical protein